MQGHVTLKKIFEMSILKLDCASCMMNLNFWRRQDIRLTIPGLNTAYQRSDTEYIFRADEGSVSSFNTYKSYYIEVVDIFIYALKLLLIESRRPMEPATIVNRFLLFRTQLNQLILLFKVGLHETLLQDIHCLITLL